MMEVDIKNSGPVTLEIESSVKFNKLNESNNVQ